MDYCSTGLSDLYGGGTYKARSKTQYQKIYTNKMNTTNFDLKDPSISARGAKTATLIKGKDDGVFLSLGSKLNPVKTPFGATSFNDEAATRKTIEFTLSPDQETRFQDFDKWAIGYLSKNSDRLFKKSLNQEQIKDLYKSPITKRGDFPPHLRCKINVSGSAICRCWDSDNNRTQIPDDLKNCDLVPRIHISHMWMMQKEVGFVLNVIDLMCIPKEEICPF